MNATDEDGTAAYLRYLWPSAGEEAVRWAARRLRGLPAKEVLRRAMLELEQGRAMEGRGNGPEGGPVSGEVDHDEDELRRVRRDLTAGRASQERRPVGQPTGEPSGPLSVVSHEDALPDGSQARSYGWQDAERDGAVRLATDGLAGRAHHRDGVVNALDQRRGGADDNEAQAGHLVTAYVKRGRAQSADDPESWGEPADDTMLPLGLDSHRYRCCGNGVVSSVSEWIGGRLREALVTH